MWDHLPALLRLVKDNDVTCILRIVQYIGDDQVGPGFALSTESISLLAQVGAFVDVDQY